MMVSSPATVPAIPSRPDSSMARATTFAVPGGVRMTTRNSTSVTESTSSLVTETGSPTR